MSTLLETAEERVVLHWLDQGISEPLDERIDAAKQRLLDRRDIFLKDWGGRPTLRLTESGRERLAL